MNIGGIGQNFYQNPMMQGGQLRQMIENSGSENLKKMMQEGASDQQLMQYAMQNPNELKGDQGMWGDAALGTGATDGKNTTGTAQQTGNASAAGSAAAGSDKIDMSSDDGDSSDSYDENDEIPTDEAMSSSQMCGMSDVSGADKAKPHAQQCLGETKAIKKVLEAIQKADQDNSGIGGDIQQVDGMIKDLSDKLKKGKKAADGAYSNPKDAAACGKECDEIVKKAADLAMNNGVEIEVSEKRGGELGAGQQQGQQTGQATGAKQANTAKQPQAAQQTQQNQQADKQKQTEQKDQQKAGQKAAEEADKAGDAGGQEEQKPFKITTEPKEVDKDLGLDEVKNNPQLAQALESSLDETMAQMDAQQQGQQGPQQPMDTFNLGATREGSPLAQGLNAIGGQQQQGGGSVFGAPQAAGFNQGGGFASGMPGGMGGGMQGIGGMQGMGGGLGKAVDTSGIEAKMKRAGFDTGKKFKVKAQVYEPGMDVKVTRDAGEAGAAGGMKVNKNLGSEASMKVKPPPLAAIDQNGEIHKLGDIKATDGGKSGIFSAKIKEGAPVMNLQSAVNSVQGDVALPGAKTEQKAT